jgi:mannose-6-phosphate isomerase-like protein (cupin superfamily)
MKYGGWDIGGDVVKKDERYLVKDNTELNNLVVSSTRLNPNCSTTGHSHAGQEEVYIFINGYGEMELDNERFEVHTGDTVLIKDGVFHRVHSSHVTLEFICVFDGSRGTK